MEARATNRGSGRRRPLVVTAVWILVAACGGDGGSPPVAPEAPDSAHAVASVEVNPSERTVGILGETVELAAGAYAADGSHLYGLRSDPGRFSWSASDPDMATVDAAAVTAVSEGTATITATVEGVKGSTTVTVRDRARFAWSVTIPGDIGAGNVMGADGTIYVGTNDFAAQRSLWHAVSPEEGVLWTLNLPLTGRSTPAIGDDGTLYLGSSSVHSDGRLIPVDPGGTVRWVLRDLDPIHSSPAIGPDGTIYVAGGHHVYAVDPQGEIQWTYARDDRDDHVFVASSPAVASDGTIYVLAGGLFAIDPGGSVRWSSPVGDGSAGTPILGADGTIYVTGAGPPGRRGIYALDPQGEPLWDYPNGNVGGSPLIGLEGTIIAAAGDELIAVVENSSTNGGYAGSPWPTGRGDRANSGRAGG